MKDSYLICVIDGQGGGIGRQIVDKISKSLADIPNLTIRALGTNAVATNNMMKAGAHDGATGENAVIVNVNKADIIVGVMPIVMPNSILGEVTPAMAQAIGACNALKILIPMQRCNAMITMTSQGTLAQYIDKAQEMIRDQLDSQTQ